MEEKFVIEDFRKVNLEINQIANQRFLLSTFAITIFGVIGAWIIPKNNGDNQNIIFIGSILLYALLLILFLYNQYLKRYLRIQSTYLLVKYGSVWEIDWAQYRKSYKNKVYSSIQNAIFFLLGFLSLSLGLIADFSCKNSLEIINWLIIFIIFICYLVVVYIVGIREVFTHESIFIEMWANLLKKEEEVV